MKKHLIGVHVEKNAYVDAGEGLITFPSGQVIIDGSKLRNGLVYDIASMDLSEYKGQITADHVDMIQCVIGEALGVARTNDAVTISGIRYAVNQNPLARLAYDLQVAGYPLDLSIETYGPWPDDSDDTYYNAKLVGLSVVVVGNSRATTMSKAKMALVRNSLEQAKEAGLDTAEVEKLLNALPAEPDKVPPAEPKAPVQEPVTEPPAPEELKKESINKEHKMFVTIKNSRAFAVPVRYKNAAGEDVETELAPGAGVDVSDDQKDAVEKQINEAVAPQVDQTEIIKNAVADALKPLTQKVQELEQNAFDKGAAEPEFVQTANNNARPTGVRNAKTELKAMDWEERTVLQIESARQFLTNNNLEGLQRLNTINGLHLEMLRDKGVVKNSVDLTAFGNFVTSPELLTTIEGVRSDYSLLVDAVGFKESLSLEMAWLERNGDIEMEEVGMSNAGSNENLKPLSQYSATPRTQTMKEVAAVTPVANAATRFLAVDLLSDVAEGYRTSYQRKLAQIVVARMQQAINTTGNSVPYVLTQSVDGLISLAQAVKKIVRSAPNGTFVMSASTELELFEQQLRANLTGDTLALFQRGTDGVVRFMGRSYIVVPDDVLPGINTNETRSFVVDGVTVTVTQAIMYADLNTVSGRVSGGLNYTLSTEAAYEDNGVTKSAFQRDELLLRGFFYRNAAVRNNAKVAGIQAAGIS